MGGSRIFIHLLVLPAVACGPRAASPDPEEPGQAVPAEIETEIEVEAPPHLDEPAKVLQVVDKGGFVIVESGFTSWEGDRCVITLDADGNLVTSVSLHSGFSCPYEQGSWKVPPQKVQELVQMMNQGAVLEPYQPSGGKGLETGSVLQTDQGAYGVVPPGKVDPVGQYLMDLYESRPSP